MIHRTHKITPRTSATFGKMLVAILIFSSCGYHVGVSYHQKLPYDITLVAIPLCINTSYEDDVEVPFTRKIIEKFHHHKYIRVVPREEAQAVLICTVRSVMGYPIAYPVSSDGRLGVAEYLLSINLDLVLVKVDTGEKLWESNTLGFTEIYLAGESPHMTESNRKSAISRIAIKGAEKIHVLLMDRF